MSQLAASDGQPGNWEEPGFFLRRLETARFQEKGWQERYDGRLSRTVLRGRGGEIPPRYSPKVQISNDQNSCDIRFVSVKSVKLWYSQYICIRLIFGLVVFLLKPVDFH
jgi:hypothetical protein